MNNNMSLCILLSTSLVQHMQIDIVRRVKLDHSTCLPPLKNLPQVIVSVVISLTFVRPILLTYRNQPIYFYCKSINWFLYEAIRFK